MANGTVTNFQFKPAYNVGWTNRAVLEQILDVMKEYDIADIKMTKAPRVVLTGINPDQLDAVKEKLTPLAGAGQGVINACNGLGICNIAEQDAIGMGNKIDDLIQTKKIPGKLMAGISGCKNSCSESLVRDIGLIATKTGWDVYVGGNAAGGARIGDLLQSGLNEQDALSLVDRFLDYYIDNTTTKTSRAARLLESMGIETVKLAVL